MKTRRAIHHCIEKRAFQSEGEAKAAMYRLMIRIETLDLRLAPYQCLFGNHYHFGKSQIKEAA